MQEIKERKLGFGEIFSYSLKVFKQNFKLVFLFTLLIYIPIVLLVNLIIGPETVYTYDNYLGLSGLTQGFFRSITVISLQQLGFALSLAAFTKLIMDLSENKAVSFSTLFGASIKNIHKILITAMVFLILVSIGFLLLFLPGLYLYVALIFYPCYIAISKDSFIDSLKKSRMLVKGNWFKVAFFIIALNIVISIFRFIFIVFFIPIFNLLLIGFITPLLLEVLFMYSAIAISTLFVNMYYNNKEVKQVEEKI